MNIAMFTCNCNGVTHASWCDTQRAPKIVINPDIPVGVMVSGDMLKRVRMVEPMQITDMRSEINGNTIKVTIEAKPPKYIILPKNT